MSLDLDVVSFGTNAVKKFRAFEAIKAETNIPEGCLSLSIASSFISDKGVDARVEVYYDKILQNLNIHDRSNKMFGGKRADIAIYKDGIVHSVIEIKIIDEKRKIDGVLNDKNKLTSFANYAFENGVKNLFGYVGVFVCETEKTNLDIAVAELRRRLDLDSSYVHCGVETLALSEKWHWVFVCAKIF